jgi:hypothetical protein
MKNLLILLFLCLAFSSPASVRYASAATDISSNTPIVRGKGLKIKKRPTVEKGTERYLMLAAIYLSAAVAVIFISLLFQPIFLFAIIFIPVFLWSMSAVTAFMAQILMLKGRNKRTADENQSYAGMLLTFMLSRLLLLLLLFFLADIIIVILFLVLLFPGLVLQTTVISRLLSAKKS